MTYEERLEMYWAELPIGREHAWSYDQLCAEWDMDKRSVRKVLHKLSYHDNGDNLILIRSSSGAGFYRTDNPEEIKAYRAECLNRGRRTLAPLRKIDRVLAPDDGQLNMTNNLKAVRVSLGYSAAWVCHQMQVVDPSFDTPMLSKMECGKCLPTPCQLTHLAAIYGCEPRELVDIDLYQTAI